MSTVQFYWFSSGRGNRYEGEFRDGNRWGKGITYFTDGRRYEGEYVNGRKWGRGTMYFPDGTVQDGIYENDAYVGPCSSDGNHDEA